MAAPLTRVLLSHRKTLGRAKFSTVLSSQQHESAVPPRVLETPGGHSRSPLAAPTGGVAKSTSESHRNRMPSITLLFSVIGYLSGRYTAIAHDGNLRRRAEECLDEFEEFQRHLRRAQELLFGWLATFYHLVVVVALCGSASPSSRRPVDFTAPLKTTIIGPFVELYKWSTNVVKPRISSAFDRMTEKAISFRCNISADVLPVDLIYGQGHDSRHNSEFRS
ncbi:hypothetical protein B0F90DRAFT_1305407 [Multifurca ochricompacta]|uniref:Uncharacterized protein n=1 Tax=Multifurca ochricompacta TaxID=376703 RepID=A0AAD4M675_9AGAM|nr:hypothetical protein B0F90DRAFT_1305407 [Multifurca ochricompacta]